MQADPAAGQVSARWRSEAGLPPPRRVMLADDRLTADQAIRLISEGASLLWQGDFQNARQLLQAMARRIDRKPRKVADAHDVAPDKLFHLHRQAQGHRARLLGALLIPVQADHVIALRRAPDVQAALQQAWGSQGQACVVSLRELQAIVGAFEWRKKGVEIPALKARIHPHYGVFSPVRGEYVQLVADAPIPVGATLAFDIGTGTGVLAAVLAQRGLATVVATDQDPRALACAADNLQRLGLAGSVDLRKADLFPEGRAMLVVCNPPWVPARPSSPVEYAVFDPDSRMLKGFLSGLAAHLAPGGEGWLILSDLAEHLHLRTRSELLGWIEAAGLVVIGRQDIRPVHPKVQDETDPLHKARAAEVTSLWRLGARGAASLSAGPLSPP